ncbi:uncharacterized protein METZ01_LOCUS6944 [marine metagenome]|uniref:Uncharacterized protein n=1 Tax=marine metagenome TaxID=408172 RepID=A0A381NHN8_9ZZZZ
MRLPPVTRSSVAESPDEHLPPVHVRPRGLRVAAALVMIVFVSVSLATTIYSLGASCLTSGTGLITLLGSR